MEDLSDQQLARGFFTWIGRGNMAWSPDSRWLAYFSTDENYFSNIYVMRVGEAADPVQVTFLPHINGGDPLWSSDGRFIVFSSAQYRTDWRVMKVDLRPIAPEHREEEFEKLFKEETAEKKAEAAGGKSEKEPVQVEIVTAGIKDRISRLVPFADNARALALSPDGKTLLFTNRASGQSILWSTNIDPAGRAETKQLQESPSGFSSVRFTKKGDTFWFLNGEIIKSLPLKGGSAKTYAIRADTEIDFHAEKLQSFREAWLMLRDQFYDPTFNAQDWSGVYENYLPYVKGARSNDDFANIVNLLLGDLNASHLGCRYFAGGERIDVGDLGLDFDPEEYLATGRFKVAAEAPGGPVERAGGGLEPGYYLLAIDGITLDRGTNIAALLERKVGKRVILTYAGDAAGTWKKELAVQPMDPGQVNALRYRGWVRDNEAYVDRVSGGRLGYVHIPDMSSGMLEQFQLDLDTQVHGKEGVVIDVRYNSGGYVAPFVIDIIQRTTTMYQSFRGRSRTSAGSAAGNRVLDKPTIVLQNEQSLSNAEMFSELYRRRGLGKIVGTESNGWVIWTGGTTLLNGAYLRLPFMKVSTLEGEDFDEAARQPDIYVERPVGQGLTGKDDQLDEAVRALIEQIDKDKK